MKVKREENRQRGKGPRRKSPRRMSRVSSWKGVLVGIKGGGASVKLSLSSSSLSFINKPKMLSIPWRL